MTGKHRRKRIDNGPVTVSFIPGDLTGEISHSLLQEKLTNNNSSNTYIDIQNTHDFTTKNNISATNMGDDSADNIKYDEQGIYHQNLGDKLFPPQQKTFTSIFPERTIKYTSASQFDNSATLASQIGDTANSSSVESEEDIYIPDLHDDILDSNHHNYDDHNDNNDEFNISDAVLEITDMSENDLEEIVEVGEEDILDNEISDRNSFIDQDYPTSSFSSKSDVDDSGSNNFNIVNFNTINTGNIVLPRLSELESYDKFKGSKGVKTSIWPKILFSMIVVLSLIVGTWYKLRDKLAPQAVIITQDQCVGGLKDIAISVTSELFPLVSTTVSKYNELHSHEGQLCYVFHVQQVGAQNVFNQIVKGNYPQTPQIWIPQSSLWVQALRHINPNFIGKDTVSLASSPVVLAVQPSDAHTIANIKWSDLQSAQQDHGLVPFNNTNWLSLKLALPFGSEFAATWLTVAAAVASDLSTGKNVVPSLDSNSLIVGQSFNKKASTTIKKLLSAAPKIGLPSIAPNAFLDLLSEQNPDETNILHSIPVLESQLINYTNKNPSAKITEIVPNDFTVTADYPAVTLGSDQQDQEAAMTFINFLIQSSDFKQALSLLGLRNSDGSEELHRIIKNTIVRPQIMRKVFPTNIDPLVAYNLYVRTLSEIER